LARLILKIIFCRDTAGLALIRYPRLLSQFIKLQKKCQAIIVGVLGHQDMPLAWLCGRLFSQPVIFDTFISLYDTYVFDRRSVKDGTLKAKFYWWLDKLTCSLADKIILDTQSQIDYFVKTFNISRHKFFCLPIGGDDTIFNPRPKADRPLAKKIIIEFHGMFTRLHGAEYFVKAAKELEEKKNLEFWLIGSSQNYPLPIKLYKKLKPKTMKYWPRLSLKKLAQKVRQADITIGHLGTTNKAQRVVSFKIMHGLASGNAVIAPDTSAVREFLKPQTHCLLVKPGSTAHLIDQIKNLTNNHQLRRCLAENGRRLFQQSFTNKKLGAKLLKIINTNC
jgi:glycosyltransferase involved in cell wall biosynthesis